MEICLVHRWANDVLARDGGTVRTRSWPPNWNYDDRVNALSSPSRRGSRSRGPNALAPVRGNGRPYLLDKEFYRATTKETKSVAFRRAYGSVRSCNACSADIGGPGVGLLLSLEMFFSVGDLLLFFSRQLLDGGLRGRSSPADVAVPGTDRGPYWIADVWSVRERTVRHLDSNFGS